MRANFQTAVMSEALLAKGVGIIVPTWCQTFVQGRQTNEDEHFFPRENFLLSEGRRQLSAERSKARQFFFPRKGKSSLEEKNVRLNL